MDSNSENGQYIPDDDADFDESDTKSGSLDERFDLDNLDLSEQRLNNGSVQCDHSTHLGCGLDTQPAGSGQKELILVIISSNINPVF